MPISIANGKYNWDGRIETVHVLGLKIRGNIESQSVGPR